MSVIKIITIFMLAYLVGSIPFGLIFVKILKGHDIRNIESGRTGGTNAGRAAGTGAGVLTGVMDFFKGFIAVMIARTMIPGAPWIEAFAAIFAILGHNYSIFLLERHGPGKYLLRGGAGGAPCMGGSFGFYPPSLFIILPVAMLILFGVGYASITTLSIAFLAIVLFTIRAFAFGSSWAYVFYGVIAQILLIIALQSNIKRLLSGNERLVGIRAWLEKRKK
jgi:acyl phosphate:glycerol-3-phosphate acyltransferase